MARMLALVREHVWEMEEGSRQLLHAMLCR